MRFSSLVLWLLVPATVAGQSLIKLATLAPEGSNWTRVIRAIDADVREGTNGEVGFKLYSGGVQGDEKTMLRKIRVGQLHGAAFGGLGASQIVPDLLALEMPFLFSNYEEIDHVLEETYSHYQKAYDEAGFVLLGWADIGFVHIISKNPVRGIDDIQKMKVWRLEGEPITEVIFRNAQVTSIPLTIPDVLFGLQTNLVEVAYAPPAVAIVLQWFTRVHYVTELPINYTLGALLITKQRFSRLSPENQEIVREVSARHMREQMRQSRAENEEAFQVLTDQGLELVVPDEEQVGLFRTLVDDSVPELVGNSITVETYEMVMNSLAAFRSANKATHP